MNKRELQKAKELEKEISEVDDFIRHAIKVWTGRLSLKKIISNAYGIFGNKEFFMNTDIKNRVLEVLNEYKAELEKQFEELYVVKFGLVESR